MEAAPVKKATPIRFLIVAAGAYMGLSALIYLSDSFRARWKIFIQLPCPIGEMYNRFSGFGIQEIFL